MIFRRNSNVRVVTRLHDDSAPATSGLMVVQDGFRDPTEAHSYVVRTFAHPEAYRVQERFGSLWVDAPTHNETADLGI